MKLVYLYFIATLSTSGGVQTKVFQMPNMDVCLAAVSAAQVRVPSAGDAETTVSLFCAGPEINP